MTEEDWKRYDELLDERCRILGMPIPGFTITKRALRGRRWTPRQAQELKDLIDAGLDAALDDRTF